PKAGASGTEKLIKRALPEGWYQNALLMRLYKVANETAKYQKLREQIIDRGAALFYRLMMVMLGGILIVIVGAVTIIVQFFITPRKIGDPADERNGANTVPWGGGTVYSIFIMWMATQIVLANLGQAWMKA